MTLREAIQQIRQQKANLLSNREADTLKIALDFTALIKLRIQQTGEDADGQRFVDYNPQYALYGRVRLGYQAEYVDFTRTGRMMNSIRPVIVKNDPLETRIVITSINAQDNVKLQGQFRKRGNILRPSDDEIQLVIDSNIQRIQ